MGSHNRSSLQQSKSIRPLTRAEILVFDGFALPDVSVVVEVFHKANSLIASLPEHPPLYEVTLRSATGGRIASSSSVLVWTEGLDVHRRENDRQFIFIAGGPKAHEACTDVRIVDWLRHQHSRSTRVEPIAEGRCLLEATGISIAAPSTISGNASLRETYTALAQAPAAALAALRIVEEDVGATIVKLISLSLSTHRTPASALLPDTLSDRPSNDNIKLALRWMDANIASRISIDAVAEAAAMSERNFLRRFRSETGMTPSDYLLRARLNLCCRLLRETHLPVDKIARRCGFSGGRHLSILFRKILSTTPTAYRGTHNEASSASLPSEA
ncbi:helix-turn-helix domain-containing protein [Caballeronia sp. ATUFL_M2_KS44]|uniref:GlxA family transcriptional regulator n=1 Tax=Caballeronia sp. ATUFL_M2_KS44 TaxID=2921767 RepID=UPI002029804A|nr:helix-turn-helix domain-containing protein [Caballeronia sp. ATUFL_M2_KS44]